MEPRERVIQSHQGINIDVLRRSCHEGTLSILTTNWTACLQNLHCTVSTLLVT